MKEENRCHGKQDIKDSGACQKVPFVVCGTPAGQTPVPRHSLHVPQRLEQHLEMPTGENSLLLLLFISSPTTSGVRSATVYIKPTKGADFLSSQAHPSAQLRNNASTPNPRTRWSVCKQTPRIRGFCQQESFQKCIYSTRMQIQPRHAIAKGLIWRAPSDSWSRCLSCGLTNNLVYSHVVH